VATDVTGLREPVTLIPVAEVTGAAPHRQAVGMTAAPRPYLRARRPRVPRGYESVDSILLTEPRIEAVRRELQALLALVQLEVDGRPVEIDGFRLRRAEDWADYPTSLSDIFWHLSSVCNFSCEFCYEKGNPPDFPIQSQPRMATDEEIATRLRLYDPGSGRGMFSVRTAINEPFANPRAIDFLRQMRAKAPGELISFVTNGSYLTEDKIAALREVRPVFFNLSLYSTDPGIRRATLRDRKGDTAVAACALLARHEIPYMANLVMWPSIPFEDMERTIAHAQEHSAAVIRVCLGGYSRYLPGDFERFSAGDYWPRVVERVQAVRDRYSIPILIEPNSYVRQDTDAVVDGVIEHSPAALAGIRRGDLITEVDGRPVRTRVQLLAALRHGARTGFRPPGVVGSPHGASASAARLVRLRVERGGRTVDVELDRYDERSMRHFPYRGIAAFNDFMYGLIVTDCLRYSSLQAARAVVDRTGARRVLLLSSELIRPIVTSMMRRTDVFAGVDVTVRVPPNEYFGGSINIGDLLTVRDFVAEVRRHLAAAELDLVLLPASPFATSPWGRDLTGQPWTDIERLTGVPTELIPCSPLVF
jgi:hypothetical protein